VTLIMQTVS